MVPRLEVGSRVLPQEDPGHPIPTPARPPDLVRPCVAPRPYLVGDADRRSYLALLGGRYRRFDRFCSERVGFDGDRAFALLAVVFIVGTLVFFTVTVRSFARFTGSGIEIGRAIPPGRTFYEYARVRSVEHRLSFRAPIGNTVHEPHYVIAFDDGSAWYSNGVHDPPDEVAKRIARMVAQRSGRMITELP